MSIFGRIMEQADNQVSLERHGFTGKPYTTKFHSDMVKFHTDAAKSAGSAKEILLHHRYAQHHKNLLNKIKGSQ